jgi:hypothetical protein
VEAQNPASRRVSDLGPFLEAVRSRQPVSGLTHNFYRYPARFSPSFARAAIESFTKPGDLVLDPFMGGGTTLVEAATLGRFGVGSDISSLATFLAKVKTRLYKSADIDILSEWLRRLDLTVRGKPLKETRWLPYQKHLSDRSTWRIRKVVESALRDLRFLPTANQRALARCILLRTSQWALDCRKQIPTLAQFREQLSLFASEMLLGARHYSESVTIAWDGAPIEPSCLNVGAADLGRDSFWTSVPHPKLIVTSPPYPGVHVLYHRWQVQGRRETPAPFWIANSRDGAGASHYTLGDRHQRDLTKYFDVAEECYRSVAQLCSYGTLMVQMIAFSNPAEQLPRYLNMLERAGFKEENVAHSAVDGLIRDGQERVWRQVPNRKWYASQRGSISASREVVLLHRVVMR